MNHPRTAEGQTVASITPAEAVVAGALGTWRLNVTAGARGISAGGGFRVYTDSDSDWGTPQFVEPAGAEFMAVESPEGVFPAVRTTGVKSLRVTLLGRGLQPGESITLVYGDMSGGGSGSRAQTFAEERRYFWIDLDADGSGAWEKLDHSPWLRIVGGQATRLSLTAIPSTVAVGETFRVVIKAEDAWGNAAEGYRGTVQANGGGFQTEGSQIAFTDDDRGVRWVENCSATEVGVLRLSVRDEVNGLGADGNPVVVTSKPGERQLYWADPHGGQVVHNGKFGEFFRYARDVSGVQFVGFQRNADVISAEDWEKQQQAERVYSEPGRFIPIPGYEWSGRTWEGGHHNIYFRRHGREARRNLPAEEMFQAPRERAELAHIRDVYAAYRNTDTIITPHVGGEHSDISSHEPELEPAVEITSTHGSFEWMAFDSLRRGYRMGFLGGSDCYTNRPGDDRPGRQLRRYAKSGLTGVYARDVSLESFFEAMRDRRVYATTGARIVLSLDADGFPIGSEFTTKHPPSISAAVAGTAPLDRVEVFRETELAYAHPLGDEFAKNRVRILWTGSSRMTSYSGVIWDGTVRVNGGRIAKVETVRFDSPRSHLIADCGLRSADSKAGSANPQSEIRNPKSAIVGSVGHEGEVRWHAWGCGYWQGIVLTFDDDTEPDGVTLRISAGTQVITGPAYGRHGSEAPRRISFAPAEQCDFHVRLSDVFKDDRDVSLGVLDRRIVVSRVPAERPLSADFQLLDEQPRPGITPYWLRVVQLDGEMAWSSPVFVDYAGEEG
jgi:Protein of unknown function (DUF3604)